MTIEKDTEARTIRNLTRHNKKRVWQSPETRRRAGEAGRRNLLAYRASVDGKPALKHGVQTFMSTGQAPAEIQEKLDAFERGLLSDLGADPSTAQRALVESSRVCLGVVLLSFSFVSQGSLSNFRRSRWVLTVLASYSNTLRLNLLALGLERRAKQAEVTLESVMSEYAAEKSPKRPDGEHDVKQPN